MRPILGGLALLVQVLASNAGHALELGGLTVASKLNEPLKASIEVKGVAADSAANTLVFSLASAQAHAAAGIPLDSVATNLIFTLDMLSRPAMVEIDSRVAIRIPFLRFLVAVDFDGQQTFREYTAMLEPAEDWGMAKVGAPVAEISPASVAELSYPGEYVGPIRQGQTLIEIARQLEVGGGISLEQRMAALVEDNPDSFIDGNMNLLREGARLHIPSERQMRQISPDQAQAVYENHLLEWTQHQARAKSSTTNGNWVTLHAPAAEALAPTTELAGIESAEYVLRIVEPSEKSASSGGDGEGNVAPAGAGLQSAERLSEAPPEPVAAMTALTDRLSVVEESLGSKELENQQLTRQVDLLQRQLEKTMKLIELQETQLAVAQKQLESMLALQAPEATESRVGVIKKAESTAPSAEVGGKGPDADPENPAVETRPAGIIEQPSQDVAEVLVTGDEVTLESAVSEAAQDQLSKQVEDIPPPWSDPARTLDWTVSEIGMLFENTRGLAGALLEDLDRSDSAIPGVSNKLLGLIVVLMLLVLILLRRRKSSMEESGALASQAATEQKRDLFETDSVAKATDGRSNEAPQAEESIGAGFVTDIETQRGVAVQSDEVDPLTESEIYLAYGRSSQAEQTLRDAIARTPERIELKLKLLEVLQVLGQKEAFGELAGELRQIVAEGSSEQAHLEKLILDAAQIGGNDSVEIVRPALSGDSPGAVNESPDEVTPEPEPVSTAPAIDDDIVFELDVGTEKEATPIVQTAESAAESLGDGTPADFSDLELELEFPAGNTLTNGPRAEEVSMAAPGEAGKADPAAALSDSDPDQSESADSEERTQLELANAYLEMGDPAAAREILTALAHSRDSDIQERAKALLETLAGSV